VLDHNTSGWSRDSIGMSKCCSFTTDTLVSTFQSICFLTFVCVCLAN
jgi:hypothetical protein